MLACVWNSYVFLVKKHFGSMFVKLVAVLVLLILVSSVSSSPFKRSSLLTSSASIRNRSPVQFQADSMPQQAKVEVTNVSNKQSKSAVLSKVVGMWAVVQVLSVLGNAIKRLYPIAVQPIVQRDMSSIQWAMYVASVIVMAYSEGYKGFQLKFAPMVIERAFGLMDQPSILKVLLAGPYSMGLFGAEKKRLIVSWALSIGVFALVVLVKRLPYPYRSIVDAGVVVGLSYGSLSILLMMIKALVVGRNVSKNS